MGGLAFTYWVYLLVIVDMLWNSFGSIDMPEAVNKQMMREVLSEVVQSFERNGFETRNVDVELGFYNLPHNALGASDCERSQCNVGK